MTTKADITLDYKGLSCPMPLMKLVKEIRKMEIGTIVKVLETNPGSKTDFPKWCKRTGNELLETFEDKGVYYYIFRLVKRKK